MGLSVHAGLVPLGKDHYLVADEIVMIHPWDDESGEMEGIDLEFPGHARATVGTVIELRDGRQVLVRMSASTVAARYDQAVRQGIDPAFLEAAQEEGEKEEDEQGGKG